MSGPREQTVGSLVIFAMIDRLKQMMKDAWWPNALGMLWLQMDRKLCGNDSCFCFEIKFFEIRNV